MITFIQDPLVRLLRQNPAHPFALEAAAAFSDDYFFGLPVSEGIPVKAIRDIYKVRAEINRDKQCGVQGYDELLHTLNTTLEPRITIHSYMTHEAKFNIFSDSALTNLIGILRIPINFQDYLAYTKLAAQ